MLGMPHIFKEELFVILITRIKCGIPAKYCNYRKAVVDIDKFIK